MAKTAISHAELQRIVATLEGDRRMAVQEYEAQEAPESDRLLGDLVGAVRQLINEIHRLREIIAERSDITARSQAEQDKAIREVIQMAHDALSVPKINPQAGSNPWRAKT